MYDGGSSAATPCTSLCCPTSDAASVVYALVSSRLTYWLWRVEGDAFHVTRRFLRELPFDLAGIDQGSMAEIGNLGDELWKAVRRRSITSINKGKRSLAFPAASQPDILDRIDDRVLQAYGLRMRARGFDLRAWYESVVVVDFGDAERASRAPVGGRVSA